MNPAARDKPTERRMTLERLKHGKKDKRAPIFVDMPAPIVRPKARPKLLPSDSLQKSGLGQSWYGGRQSRVRLSDSSVQ